MGGGQNHVQLRTTGLRRKMVAIKNEHKLKETYQNIYIVLHSLLHRVLR